MHARVNAQKTAMDHLMGCLKYDYWLNEFLRCLILMIFYEYTELNQDIIMIIIDYCYTNKIVYYERKMYTHDMV